MLTVVKNVYYCEFCKRHRLTKSAIEKHEPRCIYNPNREKCGWHEPHFRIERPVEYTGRLKDLLDVDWLRKAMDECPACMLSVVVQAGLTTNEREDLGFDYATEVERFRKAERHDYAF